MMTLWFFCRNLHVISKKFYELHRTIQFSISLIPWGTQQDFNISAFAVFASPVFKISLKIFQPVQSCFFINRVSFGTQQILNITPIQELFKLKIKLFYNFSEDFRWNSSGWISETGTVPDSHSLLRAVPLMPITASPWITTTCWRIWIFNPSYAAIRGPPYIQPVKETIFGILIYMRSAKIYLSFSESIPVIIHTVERQPWTFPAKLLLTRQILRHWLTLFIMRIQRCILPVTAG